MSVEINRIWEPQPGPQSLLIECPVYDIFFGGARGGGKTDGLCGEWVHHANKYGKAARGLFLRRTYEQVLKFIMPRMRELFLPLGAVWRGEERFWEFPNGAALYVRHLDNDSDAENFQGDSYTRVYIDELTNFPSSDPIDKMHAVLRSPHGVPCGMRASGNPGGCGHGWVKERYIDPVAPLVKQDVMYEGMSAPKSRVYIPSKLENNKYLGREYADALYLSGNRQLVRAWLEGEWDIVAGAAFDIRRDRHQLRPFRPLQHWRKWMVMDWGYVRPFSVGWYCMPDEDVVLAALGDWKEKLIPRGSIVRYREYYGWGGKANEGARLEAPDVADEIVRIEEMANEVMDYRIGDTGMWARVDGPSVAERMTEGGEVLYRDWETDRKSTRLNSSHITRSRMPSSA